MKKFLLVLALAFTLPVMAEDKVPETKKVCIEQKDAKTGKAKQVCKEVKLHKKLEVAKPDKK